MRAAATTANSFFSTKRGYEIKSEKQNDKLGALKQFASEQLSKLSLDLTLTRL